MSKALTPEDRRVKVRQSLEDALRFRLRGWVMMENGAPIGALLDKVWVDEVLIPQLLDSISPVIAQAKREGVLEGAVMVIDKIKATILHNPSLTKGQNNLITFLDQLKSKYEAGEEEGS